MSSSSGKVPDGAARPELHSATGEDLKNLLTTKL